MNRVWCRKYHYKVAKGGIVVPGTFYDDSHVDPTSISIKRGDDTEHKTVAFYGTVMEEYDENGKDIAILPLPRPKPWIFLLQTYKLEKMQKLREDFDRYAVTEYLLYPRAVTLFINGTEYQHDYVYDHITEVQVLLDQVRTDALLEEIDA